MKQKKRREVAPFLAGMHLGKCAPPEARSASVLHEHEEGFAHGVPRCSGSGTCPVAAGKAEDG